MRAADARSVKHYKTRATTRQHEAARQQSFIILHGGERSDSRYLSVTVEYVSDAVAYQRE